MKRNINFRDIGLMKFQEAWDYQKVLFEEVWQVKKANKDRKDNDKAESLNYLLFCEHPHVYTLGKSGKDDNLLINEQQLISYGAELFHIDRGGDITYHGPGQIVGYPILDIQFLKLGVKQYVHLLEEAVIQTLKEYGIEAGRLEGATGVWLDSDTKRVRKICAIGVKASHFITMHGFAFNINTDLKFFDYINPCGFTDKGVTSLSKELGRAIDLEEVKVILAEKFASVFNVNLIRE